MTSKKVVNGMKVVTRNQNVDFVSVAPLKSMMKKSSDENVVNAITCDFPCKILQNFTVQGSPLYGVGAWVGVKAGRL